MHAFSGIVVLLVVQDSARITFPNQKQKQKEPRWAEKKVGMVGYHRHIISDNSKPDSAVGAGFGGEAGLETEAGANTDRNIGGVGKEVQYEGQLHDAVEAAKYISKGAIYTSLLEKTQERARRDHGWQWASR